MSRSRLGEHVLPRPVSFNPRQIHCHRLAPPNRPILWGDHSRSRRAHQVTARSCGHLSRPECYPSSETPRPPAPADVGKTTTPSRPTDMPTAQRSRCAAWACRGHVLWARRCHPAVGLTKKGVRLSPRDSQPGACLIKGEIGGINIAWRYGRGIAEPMSAHLADLRIDLISISRRCAALLLGCASL